MKIQSTRERLLASTMICSALALALSATAAYAQDTAPAPAEATEVQEVVVTGSRIPQPNLTSVSPITAVSSQDFKLAGANDTIELLNTLPQVSVGGTSLTNAPNPLSGSGGFTTINLRNLGTVRTLVLQDGRRLMPGDPTLGGEAADLDTIPTFLIDRVDLVTGGASAVYGSDAISGVVNFVMRHDLEGVLFDFQYSENWHNNDNAQMQTLEKNFLTDHPSGTVFDGAAYTASGAIGMNSPDGKGNVTAFFTYRDQQPVKQNARDYSACQLTQASGTPSCTGSSNSNLFADQFDGQTYSVRGGSPDNVFSLVRDQTSTPPKRFNANPFEYLTRGDERYLGGFFAHYQVAPKIDVYSDFSFMDDRTVIHAGPSALFQQLFNVNCSNPFLSAQQLDTICTSHGLGPNGPVRDEDGNLIDHTNDVAVLSIGRRDIEGGPRIYSFEHISYKIDVGARGDLSDAWHYDIYAQFGRTQYNSGVQNDISLSKAQNALLVGGTAANPVCLSGPPCVPYNIFSDGGVTPGALAYILTGGTSSGDTQEQIVSANLTGQLGKYGFKSPWASDGVGVNVGAEYRREQLDQTPDETSLSGDLSGAGGALPPVHGAFDVYELFGEVRAPLVQDMPGVKNLSIEGGYRFSQYSLAGVTNTYKVGLDYAPTSDFRFRASYERAVRAPNVNELFSPQQITNTSDVSTDDCAPNASGTDNEPAAATLAECMRTGVTAAQYGDGRDPAVGGTNRIPQCPAEQCATVLGGNIKLTPEVADTYSIGVVITPSRFVTGLNFSIDYFDIKLTNAISVVPIAISYNDCLHQGTHCELIVRQANGALFSSNQRLGGYISQTNFNIGGIKTKGIDFAANYRFDLGDVGLENMGHISARFDGTYTMNLVHDPLPGEGTYDCAGLYGNVCTAAPTPKWKHNLRLTYATPWQVSISGQWRFISGTEYDGNQTNPLFGGPAGDVLDAKIPDYSYFDVSGTWRVRDGLTLRAGINNVFDKDPPILDDGITGSGTPNTYNSYDLLGRVMFIGLTADF